MSDVIDSIMLATEGERTETGVCLLSLFTWKLSGAKISEKCTRYVVFMLVTPILDQGSQALSSPTVANARQLIIANVLQ